ncbi:MAG: flagellar biosynthetic protein FliO [Gammaproteobacteria bacterium]|nr:flagellar biosynthetic protein FliO [Gammaproteobacteria bacterium]MBU1415443.1 flagellar biosynthetic protein FliO [Gammaproteobacteria bacterium]
MASVIPSRLFIASVILAPAVARAQTTATATDLGGSVVQLVLGLAVVIAMLFASLWLLKRLSAPRGEAAGLIRVVAGTAVGPRERVVILEVGGTWMVLGVAPGQVSALAEIPRVTPPAQPDPPPADDLPVWLRRLLGRPHAR